MKRKQKKQEQGKQEQQKLQKRKRLLVDWFVSLREWKQIPVRYHLTVLALMAAFSYLFYDSFLAMAAIVVVHPLYLKQVQNRLEEQKKKNLEKQFQDGMQMAAAALETGYSMEGAWQEAEKELYHLYGAGAEFAVVIHQINNKVRMNEPLDRLFLQFSQASQVESIQDFGTVFAYAKKSGGNVAQIMKLTIRRINERQLVENEIQMAMASRQFEQKIMNLMPLGILLYIRIASPGFLDVLYHNVFGVLMMSLCLCGYLGAWKLAQTVGRIKI